MNRYSMENFTCENIPGNTPQSDSIILKNLFICSWIQIFVCSGQNSKVQYVRILAENLSEREEITVYML